MHPPTKLQVFANFWPQRMLQLSIIPVLSDLSLPDYFLFPKLKMKLRGLHSVHVAEIQEAITDKLKKVQTEEFLAAFQELYDRAKACVYANGAYFEYKKVCLPHVYSIFKKISPKTFGLHCLCISSSATQYTFSLVCKLFKVNGIKCCCCVRRQSCTASYTSSSANSQTLIASVRDPNRWKRGWVWIIDWVVKNFPVLYLQSDH